MLFRLKKFLAAKNPAAPRRMAGRSPARAESAPNLVVAHKFQKVRGNLKQLKERMTMFLDECDRLYKYQELEFDKVHVMDLLEDYYYE